MSNMSNKHITALADTIKLYNHRCGYSNNTMFDARQLEELADFCESQNHSFNRERWIGYINGECGPNGGTVR